MGVSFAWIWVEHPSQWRTGVALYVLGRESSCILLTHTKLTCVYVLVITYQVSPRPVPLYHSDSSQCSLTFWTAAFPGLACNLLEVQTSISEVESGDKRYVYC